MTAQSSHWQHATYTHFTELAFPRELPRAHGDAIAASLDSTGREDEVLRSLRLTAALRTLNSRSPSPLHVVKLQANCKPAFFFHVCNSCQLWCQELKSQVKKTQTKTDKYGWYRQFNVEICHGGCEGCGGCCNFHSPAQLSFSVLLSSTVVSRQSRGPNNVEGKLKGYRLCCAIWEWKCWFLFKTN